MRVRNKTAASVYVEGYGSIPPGEEATVRDSPQVKQLTRTAVLGKVESSSSSSTGEAANDSNGGDDE